MTLTIISAQNLIIDSLQSLSRWKTLRENDNFTRVFITLSAAIFLSIFLYASKFTKSPRRSSGSRSRASPPLPPGPRGLPLVGNLLSLDPELHTYFTRLAQTYGPILKLQLGNKIGIVVSSPSLARQVLKENDAVFANRDLPIAGWIATFGGNDIASAPYGPQWRMLRKVGVHKMLSTATLDSVYYLRRREVRQTVGYVYSRVGSPVNVGEQIFLTLLNVVTNMVWGGTVLEGGERDSLAAEFRQIVSEITELLGKPNISDYYPGLARFDLQGVAKHMDGLVLRFDRMFDKVIGQRSLNNIDEEEEEERVEKGRDFLQYLLDLKDEADSKTPLTMTHVKALLMNMVIGGSDSSSNTIEFAMAELMNQPDILKKAQQELEDVIGKDNIVEESHLHKLSYLQAVVKETLRLHPILPLLIPHCPSETCTVGGYTIPKGSQLFVNVWAIQRDPSIWENPLKFDPERFFNNTKWDFSGGEFNYFPFGSGRRICAGTAMAERIVMYSLATFLHSFNWELLHGSKMDLSEKFGIVMKKKIPLVAIPTSRLNDPSLYQ